MRTTNEYVIEWIEGVNICAITCPENSALSNKLIKLAEEYPEDVEMMHTELFHVPVKWVSVRKPKQMNYTDEEKAERAERMRQFRNKTKSLD